MVLIEKNLGYVANIKSIFLLDIPKWKSQQTNTSRHLVGVPSFLVIGMVIAVLFHYIVIMLLP
jgi:hypothetical protein